MRENKEVQNLRWRTLV